MEISIIVAIGKKNAIGKDNKLLWHLSGDLKRFKEITMNHSVIMGRNTYLSLPKHPLVNRRNIVISHIAEEDIKNFIGAEVVSNINEALEKVAAENEVFIIGGAMIYKEFYPLADKLYLTLVHQSYDADTFFPEIDYNDWNLVSKEEHLEHEPAFSYLILKRKEK